MMPVIQCIGGVLYGLNHPSHVNEFVYTDPITRNTTQYTKKIIHEQMYFVADGLDQKFVEQLVLQLLK